jgi:hypothetical protein
MLPVRHFKRIVKRPHPYDRRSEIEPILDYLSEPILPCGSIRRISNETGIPRQTITDWSRLRRDPTTSNWIPYDAGRPLKRPLPPIIEKSLADHVRENWVKRGKGPVKEVAQTLARTAYASLPPGEMQRERFAASACWRDDSMDRRVFSLRTAHPERRTPIDRDSAFHFLGRLNQAKREYPPEHILNFDETCWKRVLGPNKVLAEKGTESVKLKTAKGEKESYTADGCISAPATKMPFWILRLRKSGFMPHKIQCAR